MYLPVTASRHDWVTDAERHAWHDARDEAVPYCGCRVCRSLQLIAPASTKTAYGAIWIDASVWPPVYHDRRVTPLPEDP
jgi:hypothetical protein